ncbi:uncharacterized protein LOC129572568 [Sitodiplosis mosellana]|uniref:uncharacterized protein LOC129572568 n=1 Tax=Sitodiplosis mosellana TaxID=263140 RepID=UPI002443A601|nr:uncharacterized protein LOC129572568 [Sitodiplosis mosellana]
MIQPGGTLYSFKPNAGTQLCITNATLDSSTLRAKNSEVQLWLQHLTYDHLLACVSKQMPYIKLNLQFNSDDELKCFSKGTGTVYLSGYISTPASSAYAILPEDHAVAETEEVETTDNSKKGDKIDDDDEKATGIIVEDLFTPDNDDDTIAELGDTISIRYECFLTNGDKPIFSNLSVDPFKFVLGQNVVCNGLNDGIVSMSVGSKRKIQCPPHLGYGEKGIQALIPPNASLIFVVELCGIEAKSLNQDS